MLVTNELRNGPAHGALTECPHCISDALFCLLAFELEHSENGQRQIAMPFP